MFYLYGFRTSFKGNKKINFINNYKEVQCIFGDVGIWSTHGTKKC